ncbi:MAG: hypothetical protein H8E59_01505 [Actinobacteria bacterium]|nr:hypothetical protein [Actinomycetota bacterium]
MQLAPAVPALVSGKIGVLDNGKPNARLLLTKAAEGLATRIGGEVASVIGKSDRSGKSGRGAPGNNAATACESQVLEGLSKEVRIVLTGSAD